MKTLKYILISAFALVILGGIVFLLQFDEGIQQEQVVVELINNRNSEKIYLIKTYWGLGDSRMAIGLDKELDGGVSNHYPDKFEEIAASEYFYYKLSKDTLHIYGGIFRSPKENNFQTPVIIHKISNPESIHLSRNKNYKKKELSVFPPSVIERLEYVDGLEREKSTPNKTRPQS
ncbi:MAG: hypothetical protein AAF992_18360 [Bacteroidota bacterium]